MDALLGLSVLHDTTRQLVEAKNRLLHALKDTDRESELLEQIRGERSRLATERFELMQLLIAVHQDVVALETAEQMCVDAHRQAEAELNDIRDTEYEPLKEKTNALRAKHGLPPLPSVQQEMEDAKAKYLQQRLERWTETGVIDRIDARTHASQDQQSSINSPTTATTATATTTIGSQSNNNNQGTSRPLNTGTRSRARGRPRGRPRGSRSSITRGVKRQHNDD